MRQLLRSMRTWPWGRILPVTALVILFVVLVPPARRLAMKVSSRVVLVAASPLTPSIDDFDRLPATSRVVAADGTLLAELDGGQRRDPVTVEAMPDHVVHAVLAAEDANFYDHEGVDPPAVFRAFVRTAQGRRQGGSTITQQLAKINYTDGQKTVFRKLKELLYAVELEKSFSKEELLERYLNQVYFGDGAYGIAAGADAYFGVAPTQLTPGQAATLAGMIRAPEGLDPREDGAKVAARRNTVLDAMRRHGWLDGNAAQQAKASDLGVIPRRGSTAAKAPQFVEFVKREAATIDALGGSPESRGNSLISGGYLVETTLDPKAYDAAEAGTRERLGEPGDPMASIVSVKPGDGAITNFFDGLDPNRHFDVASRGHRQPGSAFKPFVYLAAVEDGIDPRSQLNASSPMDLHSPLVGDFTVNNYEGRGQGPTSIDQAMTNSINTVYSQLALEIGPERVVETALDAGINRDIKPFPSVALGGLSDGVSPLQMAAAYATFAAKGVYAEPYAIARIKDSEGRTIYERSPRTQDAFDASDVGVLNGALQRVVQAGTGKAAAIGRPVAGKTGTTQDYGDAWFVGYVPQLATAVWVGHPDEVVSMRDIKGLDGITGGSFPAALFSETMKAALEGVPVEPLFVTAPDSLALRMLSKRTAAKPSSPTTKVAPSTSVVTAEQETTSTTFRQAPRSTTSTTAPTETTDPPRTTSTTRPPATTSSTAPPPARDEGETESGSSGAASGGPRDQTDGGP